MEDFRKKLQTRVIILAIGLGCISATLAFISIDFTASPAEGFQAGFQFGVSIAVSLVMVYYMFKTISAMKNPKQLKSLYISEMDERKLFIMQKSGSLGMNIVKFGLIFGAIIAGNFNDIVFFTLLGACFFVLFVHKFLKFYYLKKY